MKAEKLKSGSWRVKVYLGRDKSGKQRFKSITARTEREALAAAREYTPVAFLLLSDPFRAFCWTYGAGCHGGAERRKDAA